MKSARTITALVFLRPPALLALSLAAGSTAIAAAPDTSSWECKYCPFESGARGEYSVGAGHVSDDAARYGNGTGYDESGVYALLDGEGAHAGDTLLLDWQFEDLGVDSRSAGVELTQPGLFDVAISYRALPYRLFDSTSSVFSSGENFSLALPADWQQSDLTSGFAALPGSLSRRNIGSDRDIVELGGNYRPASNFRIIADYRHQRSEGVRMAGGSFFTNASLLPQPFDYATDEVDVGLAWNGSRGQVAIGFYLSLFQNQATATTWDNPFTAFPGAGTGALAQAPDNKFSQFSFNTGYSLTDDARVSLSAAVGKAEQDDSLLSYSTNPLLTTGALPRASLNGEVETTNFAASLSGRLRSNLGFMLKYRYDDRDNQTPRETWSRVITDSLLSGDSETNVPYSFTRSRFMASATADLRANLELSAGYEREETERDFQEVAGQNEDIGWGKVRWDALANLGFSLRAGSSKRKVSRYDTGVATALGQNPLLRKYNLAHRFREFGELQFWASSADKPLAFSAGIVVANDDYSKSQLGLLSSDEINYSADLSWAPAEKTVFYLNASLASIEANQSGSAGFSTPDWFASNDDEFLSLNVGAEFRDIAEGFDLSVDFSHGSGNSEIVIADVTDTAQPFPDLETDLNSARLALTYKRSAKLDWRAELRYEQFETRDWALQGVAPDTIPTVLTLGATPYDYDVLQVGIRFRYHYAAQ